MSDKIVAIIVEESTNKGRLCSVRDFEVSGKYDMIGYNLHENWRLTYRVHFKILKVRRVLDV